MTDTINRLRFPRLRFPVPLVTTLALLAILGAIAGALLLPGTAEAQSLSTYTSNTGEDTDGELVLQSFRDGIAQGFHTGDRSDGYKLESVQVRIIKSTGSTRNPEVWLYDKSSSGGPGDMIFKFLDRDIPSGTNNVRFTAPGGSRLDPNTDYFIRIDGTAGTGDNLKAAATTDHDQQEFSNWYIHNDVWLGRSSGWDEGTSDFILKISVRGSDAEDEPYVTEILRFVAPSGGAYQAGEVITVGVLFNEAVDVTGNPRLPLKIGSATRQADYGGKSAAGLNFSYIVQTGDYDADGYHVDASSLRRNGGTIKRAGTDKNADLDHPALAADSDYAVDARATAPEAPTGLTATALGATIVDLAWTAPADDGGGAIAGYKVEVSNTGTSGWSDLEDDTGNANAWYRHSGLSSGDTRHYRVSAINAAGASDPSGTADATTRTGTHHAVPATIYGDVLLSATLTVGPLAGDEIGYLIGPPVQGALTSNMFEYDGTSFTIRAIGTNVVAEIISFSYGAPLDSGLFTLHAGPFSGTFSGHAVANSDTLSGFSDTWQPGDTVDIRLVQATAPAKPTGLSATAMGSAQIDLSWTAPVDDGGRAVTGYKVEVSDDGSSGSWSDLVADTGSTDTEYSHTGLLAGQTRHYRVSAINAAGTSDASDSDSDTTQRTAPDPPAAASAIADGTTKIVVSWSAPANDGGSTITGYRLRVSSTGASGWSNLVQNTTDTTYTHTGLSAGTTRHYRVYARNAQGESQPSDVVSDMTQPTATSCTEGPDDLWCGVVTVALHTEGGFNVGYGFVDASTTVNTSDTGALSDETFSVGTNDYTIDSVFIPVGATDDILTFSLTSALSNTDNEKLVLHIGSRTFAFSGVTPSALFHYRWNSGLDWSSAGSITLRLRRALEAPGQPTNLSANADGGTRIELSWDAPADDGGSAITGYRIEVSDDGSTGSWSDLVADTGNAATSYTHTGLSPGDTRHYRVSAINANGTSEASASDDATTADPPTLSSATVNTVSTFIALRFSENLDRSAGGTPPVSAFSVSVDGVSITVGDAAILGTSPKEVWLTSLGRTIYQGQAVTVTYNDPTSGDDAAAIQDSDGDDTPSFTTGQGGVPAVVNNSTLTPPLPAPTGFRAEAGDGEVTLSWDPPGSGSGVTHHDYRFKTDGSYGDWIEIDDSGPGETNASGFTVTTDIENGTTYTFHLRAGGADDDSPAAGSEAVTPMVVLDPPTGLRATPGDQEATLTWTPPAAGSGYTQHQYRYREGTGTGSTGRPSPTVGRTRPTGAGTR